MKYSLRSLMIGITLVCVVLGGVMARVDYLRRMAVHHRREAQRLDRKMQLESDGLTNDEYMVLLRHRLLRDEYKKAVYRPWTIVREPVLRKEDYFLCANLGRLRQTVCRRNIGA
ncbi:MAG: hypothetical protein K8R36_04980 [Planctomycetales bacterium]|nr:hypothetical protein [Planctomycetales bacterium]